MTGSNGAWSNADLYAGVFPPHMLVHALSHDLDRPVMHMWDGRVLTAGQIRDLTSTYVQALQSLGIAKGTRLGVLSGNRPEVIHVGNGASLAGACLVPLHPMGSLDDYIYVIEDAGVEALVFDPSKFGDKAVELKRRLPQLKHLLSMGPAEGAVDLAALAATFQPAPLVVPHLTGEEIVRLSYSGGTTGKPKAIMGTHRYGQHTLTIQLAEWEWPAVPRQLICAPLSHAGSAVFLPTLLKGGSIVVLPAFEPVAVMEAIQKYKINCVLLVPTMIYALLDHPRLPEFDLSSLELIYYGASTISPVRLREGIEKLGPVFFQFYGQAEAPMTVTVMRRAEHDVNNLQRLASCGRPVPWVHVALLDDEGEPVAEGTPGEICVRGPLVMAGYLNKPEQTAEAFANGWLHTGDVAVRDPDGFLRIVDRKKDMIITGGFNVFPREIEDVLTAHPAVSQAGVVGVKDEKWGEAVKAVVVLRPGAKVTAEELIALVRDRKGAVQAPKTVDFIDAIPLSPLGKPDKKALRAMYAAAAQGAK